MHRLSTRILGLAFLNLLLLGATLAGLAGVQLQNMNTLLLAPTRDRVLAEARLIALELARTPEEARDRLLQEHSRERGVTFYLLAAGGGMIAGPGLVPPVVHARSHQSNFEESFFVTTRNPTQYWAGVRIPIGRPGQSEPTPGILLLTSNSLFGNVFFLDWALVGSILFVVVLISAACWVPLLRGLRRSFLQLNSAAQRIANGDFDVEIPTKRNDELGQLSLAVNQMGARLKGYVSGQKRFLSDIAHELCSPIGRAQVALSILDRPSADVPHEQIRDLREEIDHMSALVSEILLFSKAEINAPRIAMAPVNVEEAIGRAVAREAKSFAPIGVQVPQNGLQVMADQECLVRALSNLIRNSIRYAGPEGGIQVSAVAQEHEVAITVSDRGPGLPEEALEDVFKPFHRLDDARGRESGGVGLGLAIVKSCVDACGGTVRCMNLNPTGLAVRIHLQRAA